MFGPFFGIASEERAKDISLIASADRRELEEDSLEDSASCETSSQPIESGIASWYGKRFHGRTMANGQPFDMEADTVAHRTLPFGTRLCIENPRNGKSVQVIVTDRGRFHEYGRAVDLSKRVAEKLEIIDAGIAPVRIYLEEA